MILDHNFMDDESIGIQRLITWLQAEKKGGAESVRIIVSHVGDAHNDLLVPLDEYDEDNPIATVKLEAE